MTPPSLRAQDWLTARTAIAIVLTWALLLGWLAAIVVAWVRWTSRSMLESAALVALGLGALGVLVAFLRSIAALRRRYRVLAERGVWLPAEVTDIARGPDPTGVEIGVAYRWIVTATAAGPDGAVLSFRSRPVWRRRDVAGLMGGRVWVCMDPDDPRQHVLLPLLRVA